MKTIATGNKAVAEAVRLAGPVVVAAFPITPQTEVVEQIAMYVSTGAMTARYNPGRKRALGDGGMYRRHHHRCPHIRRYKLARPAVRTR